MTNQQPIKPVFKAERVQTDGWHIPVSIIDESSMSNGSVTKRKSYIKPYLDCYKIDESTLQISLDGENFHSMEFVREAIEYYNKQHKTNKCQKCGNDVGNNTFTWCDDCWEEERCI